MLPWTRVRGALVGLCAAAVAGLALGRDECALEAGVQYDSLWNETALRVCERQRHERVCIVGGGSSGVHMGWLLKRRGFGNTVLFEQNDRLGGDIWTRFDLSSNPHDTVTRELGAAFLSPDYDEVRALLRRFNQSEQPISSTDEMRFHTRLPAQSDFDAEDGAGGVPQDRAVSPAAWSDAWLAHITGSDDTEANNALVDQALDRYYALHESIFGDYGRNRFPPEPETEAQLFAIRGTGWDFLQRNHLEVLEPMFYQFYDLQGMGLMRTIPAYYMLKWCSPASLQAGGFGGDIDTPLAMLPNGFGSMVDALAKEVGLDVRFNTTVWSVERNASAPVRLTVVQVPADAGAHAESTHECDFVVLSGPVTQFVRGSNDGTRAPILHPATDAERAVFAGKQPMQFLIQLLDLEESPVQEQFRALEFWPAHFQTRGGVIVRRDVAYAEEGVPHTVGGLQSYSSEPWPACDEARHDAGQRAWLTAHNLTVRDTLARVFFDNYLYHLDDAGVMARKPWRVGDLQSPHHGTRTLYVGGCASFETVEDSLQYNLELVDRFFDRTPPAAPQAGTWPDESQLAPRLEQLSFQVPCVDVPAFVKADAETWSRFLVQQKGFVRKRVLVDTSGNTTQRDEGNCTVWSTVQWASLELWKAIPADEQSQVEAAFASAFGSDPEPTAFPPETTDGLEVLLDVPLPIETYAQDNAGKRVPARGVLETTINALASCDDADAFVAADNATWTRFLSAQPGFVRKATLLRRKDESQCDAWTQTYWASYDDWQAAGDAQGGAAVQAAFVSLLGYAPAFSRWPADLGYLEVLSAGFDRDRAVPVADDATTAVATASHEEDAPHRESAWWSRGPRVVAVGGNDVVAYHSGLAPGVDHDVRGSSAHRRFVDAADVMFPADAAWVTAPPSDAQRAALLRLHPEPYEFWFASAENAALFDADRWRYLPAFGGHCTHGIASLVDGELTAAQMVDGRLGFTCVNTTRWTLLNGTLYMNSCGMYEDFIKDPEGDAEAAAVQWAAWFGALYGAGPVNDACFQDEYTWGADPVGGLLPPNCNIM